MDNIIDDVGVDVLSVYCQVLLLYDGVYIVSNSVQWHTAPRQ